MDSSHSTSLSDSLSYSTALINSLNNTIAAENKYLALLNIFITFFALLVAIIGVLTFWDIKGRDKYKEEISNTISGHEQIMKDRYDEIKGELRDNINEINALNNKNNDSLKEYRGAIEKTVDGIKKELNTKINEINSLNDKNESNLKDYKRDIDGRIDVMKKELSEKIEVISRLNHSVDEKAKEIESLEKKQDFQNRYLQRINEYLFSITNTVVDNTGIDDKKRAQGVKIDLLDQYHIVKAFLPWSDNLEDGTEATFRYLQNNGAKDQIEDLLFIAENDPDDKKRNIARETIGSIRIRTQNDKP